jgi:hypothetical protein
MSYADEITTARQIIPLAEIGVESVNMKRTMTDAVVIKVPGDKNREKASLHTKRLARVGSSRVGSTAKAAVDGREETIELVQ